jgi:hypothetical protein
MTLPLTWWPRRGRNTIGARTEFPIGTHGSTMVSDSGPVCERRSFTGRWSAARGASPLL